MENHVISESKPSFLGSKAAAMDSSDVSLAIRRARRNNAKSCWAFRVHLDGQRPEMDLVGLAKRGIWTLNIARF